MINCCIIKANDGIYIVGSFQTCNGYAFDSNGIFDYINKSNKPLLASHKIKAMGSMISYKSNNDELWYENKDNFIDVTVDFDSDQSYYGETKNDDISSLYIRKDSKLKAVRFSIDEHLPDWFMDKVSSNDIVTHNDGTCDIKTDWGTVRTHYGDYIALDEKGHIFPCAPCIFEELYEPYESSTNELK